MDLYSYFKKCYQYQLIFIDPTDKNLEKENKLKVLDYNTNLLKSNDGYNSNENFKKFSLREINSKISLLLETVESYKIKNKIVFNQLLIFSDYQNLNKGSYYVSAPFIFKTGDINDLAMNYVTVNKKNFLLLICVDLKYLELLGRDSFALSLKQTGELKVIIKQSCLKENLEIKEIHSNLNKVAHDAGLNINKILVLEALMVSEVSNVI